MFGVLIVDDSRLFLQAARVLLEREGLRVVGVAVTAAQALRRAAELRPEVVLVDIMLGGESGFDLARRLSGHDRGGGDLDIDLFGGRLRDLIAESPCDGVLAEGRAVGARDPADRRWRRASRPVRRSRALRPAVRPGRLTGKLAPLPQQGGWHDRMADDQERRLCERHDHDWLTILIPAVSAPYPAATAGQRPAG